MPKPIIRKPKNIEPEDPKMIGCSGIYRIKKYGLYRYQTYRMDPVSQLETKIGEPNVYGVVASDLIDLIFNDINPEHK